MSRHGRTSTLAFAFAAEELHSLLGLLAHPFTFLATLSEIVKASFATLVTLVAFTTGILLHSLLTLVKRSILSCKLLGCFIRFLDQILLLHRPLSFLHTTFPRGLTTWGRLDNS